MPTAATGTIAISAQEDKANIAAIRLEGTPKRLIVFIFTYSS